MAGTWDVLAISLAVVSKPALLSEVFFIAFSQTRRLYEIYLVIYLLSWEDF